MDNYYRNMAYARVLKRRRRLRYLLRFGYKVKGLKHEGADNALRDPYDLSLSFISNKMPNYFHVSRSNKDQSLVILKISDEISSVQAFKGDFVKFKLKEQLPERLLLLTINVDDKTLSIFRDLLTSNCFHFRAKFLQLKLTVNPIFLEEKHFEEVKVIHDSVKHCLSAPTVLLIETSGKCLKLDHDVSEKLQKFLPEKKIPEFELKMNKFSLFSYYEAQYGCLMRTTYHDISYGLDFEKHVNWFVRYFAVNQNLFQLFTGSKERSLLPYTAYYQMENIRSSPIYLKIFNWQGLNGRRETFNLFFRKYQNVILEVDQLKDADSIFKNSLQISKYYSLSEILTIHVLLNERDIFYCFNDIQFLTGRTLEQVKLFVRFKYKSQIDKDIIQCYNEISSLSLTIHNV